MSPILHCKLLRTGSLSYSDNTLILQMKKLRLRDALIISVQFNANYFLDMTLKAKPMKEKYINLITLKFKTSVYNKGYYQRNKQAPQRMGEIYTSHIFNHI